MTILVNLPVCLPIWPSLYCKFFDSLTVNTLKPDIALQCFDKFMVHDVSSSLVILLVFWADGLHSWALSKIVPRKSRIKDTLDFPLDHPRWCFVHLLLSYQMWFLLQLLHLQLSELTHPLSDSKLTRFNRVPYVIMMYVITCKCFNRQYYHD